MDAMAIRIQRWRRAHVACRAARVDLQLLRDWDELYAAFTAECERLRAARTEAERREVAAMRIQLASRIRNARVAAATLRLQCAARRRAARRQLRELAALRLQCATRQLLARRKVHDTYWAYAYGLLNEDTAVRLQRWWRMRMAQRAACEGLQLLREWDTLAAEVAAAKAERTAAVSRLQRAVRRHTTDVWVDAMSGGVEAARAASGGLDNEMNPFSAEWVGQTEHRRRVEANQGGRLKTYGNPSLGAQVRALPSQLATLFNTLRFVDAVNTLLERDLVEVSEAAESGERSASYDALMAWGDKALQARFSAATQYLKSAKRFGLLHYAGELLHEGIGKAT